jgi:hypothetical protein
MTPDYINRVLLKDLEAFRDELRAYPDEADVWVCPPGIKNSCGNLILHVTGNLRHFIGAQIGESGYVRDRDAEFSDGGVTREELEEKLSRTSEEVTSALAGMEEKRLNEEFPLELLGERMPTGMFLLRLVSHLAYHLGQMNYHRRVATACDGESENVA